MKEYKRYKWERDKDDSLWWCCRSAWCILVYTCENLQNQSQTFQNQYWLNTNRLSLYIPTIQTPDKNLNFPYTKLHIQNKYTFTLHCMFVYDRCAVCDILDSRAIVAIINGVMYYYALLHSAKCNFSLVINYMFLLS